MADDAPPPAPSSAAAVPEEEDAEAQKLLSALCVELAEATLQRPTKLGPTQKGLDAGIENVFGRLDDITALQNSVSADIGTTQSILPTLVTNAEKLEGVFAIINRIEAFAENSLQSAQAMAERATELEKVDLARNPKRVARFMRSLSIGKRTDTELSDWDPEPMLFNTTEVFDDLRREAAL